MLVHLLTISVADVSGLYFRNNSATSVARAQCTGVRPSLSRADGLQPCSNNSSAISADRAQCSGVFPSLSSVDAEQPCASNSFAISTD
eukprot:m.93161 g.93161  ORF g.93161 m.93161 type:complete len:88 (-) comp21763_c0_seq3:323-586(-)